MLKLPAAPLALVACVIVATLFAQTIPPVYFNHVTVYLPSAAYRAIEQSSFLRNVFSKFEEQTVQRDGGTWSYTGVYLFGQHTYFEFFEAGQQVLPGGTIPTPAGLIGFNMWLDDRKNLPLFSDRFAAESGSAMEIVTTRNGTNQPAYDSVSRKGPFTRPAGVRALCALKGYYPDGITREKRLEDRYLPGRDLRDITAFTLTVNDGDRDRLLQAFRAYSYAIQAEGEKRIASGPGIVIALVPLKPGEPRRLAVDLSVNRAAASEQDYKFEDTSELRVEGSTAKWTFTFPNN
jgi:hypothetical protein